MTTEIASCIPGRAVHQYDLLDEVTEATGMTRREAHENIHAFLDQIIELDGEEAVILSRRPIRPDLLTNNPNDQDRYHWLTISDEAADVIRAQFAN